MRVAAGRRVPGGHLRGPLSAAYPAYPEGPLARTHYIIGRDEGDDAAGRPRHARRGHRDDRAHLGATPCARRFDRRRRAARPGARVALRQRLHAPPIARPSAPTRPSSTSASSSSSPRARPRAVDLYRREGDDDKPRSPEGLLARRAAAAVGARAAARKSRLPRRQRADLPRGVGGRREHGPRLAPRHDAGARDRRAHRHRRDPAT